MLDRLDSIIIRILLVIIILFVFSIPSVLYADTHKFWVDTSHWESVPTEWIEEGRYETVSGRRWVDTSYTVSQGNWQNYTENVWVSEGHYEYGDRVWVSDGYWDVTEYDVWVSEGHWETGRYYYWDWVSCNKTFYDGCTEWGWGYYSFVAKPKGNVDYVRGGVAYRCHKFVIDYRPHYGGQSYCVKYEAYLQKVISSYSYTYWVDTSHWGIGRYYDWIDTSHWMYNRVWVDTSHWETVSGRRWVDTSYTVYQGYWQNFTENVWIDTSHWEHKDVWIEDGYYISPLHGGLVIEKSPEYIFTKWHKDDKNMACSMELSIKWEVDNSNLLEDEKEKEIAHLYIYEDVHRFNDKGVDRVIIFDEDVPPSAEGSIDTSTEFEYSGNENSMLYIYLFAQNGESAYINFSNPINGFRSINLNLGDSSSDADRWLGGITYEKFEF